VPCNEWPRANRAKNESVKIALATDRGTDPDLKPLTEKNEPSEKRRQIPSKYLEMNDIEPIKKKQEIAKDASAADWRGNRSPSDSYPGERAAGASSPAHPLGSTRWP